MFTDIDPLNIKTFKLSYKKVQIEYMIPVYLCDIGETIHTPIDSILIQLRYRRYRDEFRIEQSMLSIKLATVSDTYVGSERATVKYQHNVIVSDGKRKIELYQIPKCILVKNKNYTMVSREMKLQSLL